MLAVGSVAGTCQGWLGDAPVKERRELLDTAFMNAALGFAVYVGLSYFLKRELYTTS